MASKQASLVPHSCHSSPFPIPTHHQITYASNAITKFANIGWKVNGQHAFENPRHHLHSEKRWGKNTHHLNSPHSSTTQRSNRRTPINHKPIPRRRTRRRSSRSTGKHEPITTRTRTRRQQPRRRRSSRSRIQQPIVTSRRRSHARTSTRQNGAAGDDTANGAGTCCARRTAGYVACVVGAADCVAHAAELGRAEVGAGVEACGAGCCPL